MGLRRLSIVTIALAAAGGAALADIGPKPRIDIAFSFDRPGLSI